MSETRVKEWETVIGLEVHAQLFTQTKLFCRCSTSFGAEPNTNVCPNCLGLPGSLPVPNKAAIHMAVRAGLALGCQVRERSRFARKNYFYPDLPKGYQISQYELPVNEHGKLEFDVDGVHKSVTIQRIHLEEDAAKNLHATGPEGTTLVDFNRSGVPLIEIVSGPDLRSAGEAEAYLRKLREVLMFIGINDGNLEEGSFRCDANVSIRPRGAEKFGTRVELKNINSFRFVSKAIEYEAARQQALIESGEQVRQETRTWHDGQGKTIAMRGKEEAQDYRYFPDPDLPELHVSEDLIAELRASAPELAEHKRARYQRDWGLTEYDASVLTGHPEVARYFEQTAVALAAQLKASAPSQDAGKRSANFIQAEVLRDVQTQGLQASFPVDAEKLATLLALVAKETVSGKMAKDIYAEMVQSGEPADRIVEKKGLSQITDAGAIEALVRGILDAHPSEVEKYRAGKVAMHGFFVGQVMRASKGTANPALVNETLKKLLDGTS
jgi:aspartyl-tRNA(Asn)/glutamyl-tRNA(Gln) amidotransferase subunit B